MALRYDFLGMMRNRVGAEGVSPEELQAIAGWLEASRRALSDRKKAGELGFFDVPKRRPNQKRMTSPAKLPNQQTARRAPKLSAPECAA